MNTIHTSTTTRTAYTPLSTLAAIWLIARRQMIEALWTRSSLVMFGVSLVINTFVVWSTIQPIMRSNSSTSTLVVGNTLAFLLLLVALLNGQPAIGIAAGVFAGDKERGCLLPLLATPASNTALLAGKVLGAVIPALLYTIAGIIVYLIELVLLFGTATLALMPLGLSLASVAFIPALFIFAATIASLISSRVATFQSAQTYSSLITTALWLIFGALVFVGGFFALWIFVVGILVAYLLDGLLILLAARTWQREEVMAKQ
ncbi:MAG: ABC transporter permease subunit [Ktedonobacteraceae bacterium]|nr:ABC transporter permease subunit [Ktedonobacteraceae bacterium]